MKYIIKPFSEIMIKSKPVRKRYMSILQSNISKRIKTISEDLRVQLFWDKLEVNMASSSQTTLSDSEIKQLNLYLSRIPGIEAFHEVIAFDYVDFEQTFSHVKDFYLDKIRDKSFVVRVKRCGDHDFKSTDLERYLGGGLLKALQEESIAGKVDVRNAQVTVKVDIKDTLMYVIKHVHPGIGGYPTGVQEKIISLLSGGFDSGVSTYAMMKRGCKVDFLFFNLGGSAHELGVKQVAYYLNQQFSTGYNARIITVPFEKVVRDLVTNVDHRFRGIILKRCMLKIADALAKQHEYYAIVKGDSLGQVSSQTLKNMHAIDKACDTLVLRPLISFNKQEIVDISQKIGTYNFAVNMPEYCGVISDKPATAANILDVLKAEEKFNVELLDQAYENKKVEKVIDVINHAAGDSDEIETINFPAAQEIIIDIRESSAIKKSPLQIENCSIIEIPFFDINNKFKDLDQSKTYLLYCEKGVLSKLHGLYIKEKGFENVKVFKQIENDKVCGSL